MAKTLTPPEALHRAAALCSSSEHCIADIREKLSRWGIGEPDAPNNRRTTRARKIHR